MGDVGRIHVYNGVDGNAEVVSGWIEAYSDYHT